MARDAQGAQVDQLQIDCSTGNAMEVLLDPEEVEPFLKIWEQTGSGQQKELNREAALARLQDAATRNSVVRDLLTVLGLEG